MIRFPSRRSALATSALLLGNAAPATMPAQAPPPASAIAITRVSVVPMDRERVLSDQTVIVRDGRIVAVGPAASTTVPRGATVVDGRGKFLMPGLSEMHAHVPPPTAPPAVTDRVMTLYVVNGVTTIRGMLGDASHLTLRDRLARGELLGPRLTTSGPSFNGNSVKTPQQGIDSVLAQKKAGYDLLKIHPGLSRETFDSVAATATRVGIPFAGHVPLDVGYARALSSRYATIEHADGLLEAMLPSSAPVTVQQGGFFGLGLVDHLDTTRLAALVRSTREAGVWIVPSAALMETMTDATPAESLAVRPEMAYWLPNQVNSWKLNKQNLVGSPQFTMAQRERFIALRRRSMLALQRGGVPFLLGSDSPQIWNVPGFSAHRELEALVASGFTPYEALATGTVNVARYLGETDRGGTVQAGRHADLVLVDGNPLVDVRNAARISGVMVRGRWLPRAEIDAKLSALKN